MGHDTPVSGYVGMATSPSHDVYVDVAAHATLPVSMGQSVSV